MTQIRAIGSKFSWRKRWREEPGARQTEVELGGVGDPDGAEETKTHGDTADRWEGGQWWKQRDARDPEVRGEARAMMNQGGTRGMRELIVVKSGACDYQDGL